MTFPLKDTSVTVDLTDFYQSFQGVWNMEHIYNILFFFFLILQLQGQIKSSFTSTENYHTLGCLNLVAGDLASEIPVIIGVILFFYKMSNFFF